jgi:hypothetical protein
MDIKLDSCTPTYLTSMFIMLMRQGVTPNQIMAGIAKLAQDTNEFAGRIVSADCLQLLLLSMPIDTDAQGVTEYVFSLAGEGVNTLMLLDALSVSCYVCGHFDSANLLRLTYKRLQADAIISQMLGS